MTPVHGDITDPDLIAALVDTTSSIGKLRVLVHTAGLSPSMAGHERIVEVNLLGTALVERAFLPIAKLGTAAILIASSAGHMSPYGDRLDALFDHPLAADFMARASAAISSGEDAYFTSKRGVIRYCEQVAPEWAKRGARITTISPGMIDTPMNALEFAKQPLMRVMLEVTPIPRYGTADEIAAAVEFLASEDASFITSTDLRIDGGSTPVFRNLAAHRARA